MNLAQALLSPRSVALVGASDDTTRTTGRPLRFLRQAGYRGKVYPVNPNRATVQGEPAWPSVEALPETPEHAYIVVGTDHAIDALEACGRRGIPVATMLAAGFSEAGPEGLAREERVRRIVRETGIRLVGPSSLGVVNIHEGVMLTANAAFAEPDMKRGAIFVASHSGSMIGSILSRGKARGVGFAGLVSVGNEVDLGIGEICQATLEDERIGGYLLFLETLRRAPALREFAWHAAQRGKPVIAYKLGRSEAAAELAVSHTGALAGEDDVADAFLKDCGIARVHTLDALIEGLPLLTAMDRRSPAWSVGRGARGRVGVVTTTGGGAAMVVDQLGVRGITVQAPSSETLARMEAAGAKVSRGRIADLTLAGTKYAVMKGALDVLLSAPEFDLIVAVPGSSARFEPDLAVRPIIDSAGGGKPLVAFVVPDAPDALARLGEAGVPNFRAPESCADAIAAAFGRRVAKRSAWKAEAGETRFLDELEAYKVLESIGVAHAPAEGIDPHSVATSLAFPVALKVLSAAVPHKSDVGGVVLGVRDAAALGVAIDTIRRNLGAHGLGLDRVLVQSMASGAGEALVGYRVDPAVGPLVMLAAGGVMAEIHRDRSLRLAPVDLEAAREMVAEVKAFRALAGFRDRARGDLEALARAVVAVSALAARTDIVEAEVNPLMVCGEGQGVVAVDALVRVRA